MALSARRGVRGPRGVAQRRFQPRGVGRLVLLPFGNAPREGELAEGLAQQSLELALERRSVEGARLLRLELVHGFALNEQALDRA